MVKEAGRTMIVDAMSSFAGVDIRAEDLGIDFIISSANKCIQGVPGFSFIICSRKKLSESEGKASNLSLDLYDQWNVMKIDGKWRFTSPTHTVLAFAKALRELEAEGGIAARSERYYNNNSAGVRTVGIIEGSSLLGLTEEDFNLLPASERECVINETKQKYLNAGADWVVRDIRDVIAIIEGL